ATGLARRLPSPRVLLDLKRQRADELGDRLPRALRHRLTDARAALGAAGSALRPRLLADRLALARQKLVGARLRPALVEKIHAERRGAFERLWRVAESLNPDAVLRRGYARVEGPGGHVVSTVAGAL